MKGENQINTSSWTIIPTVGFERHHIKRVRQGLNCDTITHWINDMHIHVYPSINKPFMHTDPSQSVES